VDGRDVTFHGRLCEGREVAQLAFETSLVLVHRSGKKVLIMDFKIILLNKDKTKEMKSLNKNRASIPRGWQVNSA
jgi:hypothetical protein